MNTTIDASTAIKKISNSQKIIIRFSLVYVLGMIIFVFIDFVLKFLPFGKNYKGISIGGLAIFAIATIFLVVNYIIYIKRKDKYTNDIMASFLSKKYPSETDKITDEEMNIYKLSFVNYFNKEKEVLYNKELLTMLEIVCVNKNGKEEICDEIFFKHFFEAYEKVKELYKSGDNQEIINELIQQYDEYKTENRIKKYKKENKNFIRKIEGGYYKWIGKYSFLIAMVAAFILVIFNKISAYNDFMSTLEQISAVSDVSQIKIYILELMANNINPINYTPELIFDISAIATLFIDILERRNEYNFVDKFYNRM